MSLFLRCHGYRVQNYYKSLHLYIATCPFSIAVCNGIPDSLFTEYVDKIKSHSSSNKDSINSNRLKENRYRKTVCQWYATQYVL